MIVTDKYHFGHGVDPTVALKGLLRKPGCRITHIELSDEDHWVRAQEAFNEGTWEIEYSWRDDVIYVNEEQLLQEFGGVLGKEDYLDISVVRPPKSEDDHGGAILLFGEDIFLVGKVDYEGVIG